MNKLFIALMVVMLAMAACTSPSSSSGGVKAKDCIEIKLLKCGIDVQGKVINKCSRPVMYIKVVSYAYESKGGKLIGADPEYIANAGEDPLAPNDDAFFESPIGGYGDKVGYCEAEIDEATYR